MRLSRFGRLSAMDVNAIRFVRRCATRRELAAKEFS